MQRCCCCGLKLPSSVPSARLRLELLRLVGSHFLAYTPAGNVSASYAGRGITAGQADVWDLALGLMAP